MTTTPLLVRAASVFQGTTEIGYCKGITIEVSADLVKEYKIGDDDPAVLSAGNKSYKATIDKMYIDSTYRALVVAGTPVTLKLRPSGTGAGNEEIQLTNFVFTSAKITGTQEGVFMENLSGEGTALLDTTQ